MLVKRLFLSGSKEGILCYLDLVLDWWLTKHKKDCISAKTNHIQLEDAFLLFKSAKQNDNKRGENHCGPWHIYSNPRKLWHYSVLALALYLLVNFNILKKGKSHTSGQGCTVFTSCSNHFNILNKETKYELNQHSFSLRDLGISSDCKGTRTIVATECAQHHHFLLCSSSKLDGFLELSKINASFEKMPEINMFGVEIAVWTK